MGATHALCDYCAGAEKNEEIHDQLFSYEYGFSIVEALSISQDSPIIFRVGIDQIFPFN